MNTKYYLFLGLFLAVVSTELLYPVSELSQGITGNAIADVEETRLPPFSIFLGIVFLILSTIYLFRGGNIKKLLTTDNKRSDDFVSLILRLTLGLSFIMFGLDFTEGAVVIAGGVFLIIQGLLIIIGLFSRLMAYIAVFTIFGLLFIGMDVFLNVIMLGIALSIFLLGGARYSLDRDLFSAKKNA